jgi:hypothetical protein
MPKRIIFILALLVAVAHAQVTFLGNVKGIGNVAVGLTGGGGGGGGPLTYTARVDDCVHGTSSPYYNPSLETCTPGATTGMAGSAMLYQGGNSDPLPFNRLDAGTNPAVANTSFVDPDFNSYSFFATDQTRNTNTTIFNLGSDGAHDAFALGTANDVLFTFKSDGGITFLDHIIESRVLAETCSPSNPCAVASNIAQNNSCTPKPTFTGAGVCTNTEFNGPLVFSRNPADPPNTVYALYTNNNSFQIWKSTVTSSTTGGFPNGAADTLNRSLWIDFLSDGAGYGTLPCSVLPSDYNVTWTGTFESSTNGSFSIAVGGGGSYQTIGNGGGGPQTIGLDTFIMPVNNISGIKYDMFQYVPTSGSTGTTTGTEPNWAANCNTQGSSCADGTGSWLNIGKVNGQGPGFDIVHFDPTRGCSHINSRLMKMYRGHNEGTAWPSSGTADPSGQLYTDDAVACYEKGGSSCGSGGTVPFTDESTLHDNDQSVTAPNYSRLSPTGGAAINQNYAGGGGKWPEISPVPTGTCSTSINYTQFPNWPAQQWVSNFAYTGANEWAVDPLYLVYYKTNNAVTSTTPPHSDPTNWTIANYYCDGVFIDWNTEVGFTTPMVRPQLLLGPNFGAGSGHPVDGNNFYGSASYWSHYWTAPQCATTNANPPQTLPYCPYIGSPNPGLRLLLANQLPSDDHPTYRQVGAQDLQPMFAPTSSVPNWGNPNTPDCSGSTQTGCSNYIQAGYGELIAWTTDGLHTLYRFGHNFGLGTTPSFSVQNTVGVISQDGLMLGWGSDFQNTRGDAVSGSATCACSNSSGATVSCGPSSGQTIAGGGPLHAQYQWLKSSAVTVGDYLMVLSTGNIYQAQNSGTSGTAVPTWCTSAVGCTNGDGTVTWALVGQNSCRGDLAIMKTQSAAPTP